MLEVSATPRLTHNFDIFARKRVCILSLQFKSSRTFLPLQELRWPARLTRPSRKWQGMRDQGLLNNRCITVCRTTMAGRHSRNGTPPMALGQDTTPMGIITTEDTDLQCRTSTLPCHIPSQLSILPLSPSKSNTLIHIRMVDLLAHPTTDLLPQTKI